MQPIDFLLRTAGASPHRIALEADDVSVTYGELARQVSALAAAFQDIDPAPGSRVAICSGNSVLHVIALMATLAASKTWVPLNPRSAGPELARIVEFTTPSILVFDDAHREQACHAVPSGTRRLVCSARSQEPDSVEALLAAWQGRTPRRHSRDLSEIQAIKFTGGTTGAPKGVMQSLRAWNATAVSILTAMQLRQDERYLAVASITHGTSTFLLPVFACGGTIVLASSTKPKSVLDQLEGGRITATFMPPTLIYDLLDEPGVAERDWSHLRHLVYAAAPMRADRIAQAIEVFGTLETSFGQTEAPAVIAFMPAIELRNPERHGSVGRATPLTEIGIMAPDGRLLLPGETGEIVVRGDLLMSGYWRQPEKTAETIIDGWLHTGDGGYLDAEGFLYLKDRLRDMVISGGFNVYPTDVENALGEHPAVCRCAVFGVEDPRWGEAVHAVVQLRPGTSVSADTLRAIVRARLGPVQTPKQIHFLDSLPVTANGKVSKQVLRAQFMNSDDKPYFSMETLAS
ncbi:AMP-dependent synthetase and ligase (plasmid) [Cupriavidus taiwanensis]|uniref:AMP-dependent synthetase and ligase n=1 Tax=Cupriavidus taiwanensis TaxID=164546 RepID=A0A375IMN6_9BURK|nr:AMP-binding protein [Cupriavidus taiwanensis]SPK75953.1 AMP-dependent synthetase and ligase [Cupriavidus taiwanensis]